MSHIANITTEIKDIEAVKAACKEMGFTFHEGQQTYAWWGSLYPDDSFTQRAKNEPPEGLTANDLGKCHHAISIPGIGGLLRCGDNLQVGLLKTATGYRIVCDDILITNGHYKDETLNAMGNGASKFIQTYAVHKATIEARKRGYMVSRTAGKNGSIQLVVTGIK